MPGPVAEYREDYDEAKQASGDREGEPCRHYRTPSENGR